MKGILSLFSMRGKRRNGPMNEEGKPLSFFPETQPDPPSVPEPDLRNGESLSEGGAGGMIRRMTELIRNLAVWTEETIREAAEPKAVDPILTEESRGEVAFDGRDGLFSVPAFRAEVSEENMPFRRGGFTGETAGDLREYTPEPFRLLLDRTEEMKEVLFRLNETADHIRKELTV